MKKTFLTILIIILILTTCSCKNNKSEQEKIISKVDINWTYYQEIATNQEDFDFEKGFVKNIYKSENKIVFLSIGKYGYNGNVEIVLLIKDNKISDIENYQNEETGGIGSKAFNDEYLNQFLDIDISEGNLLNGGSRPNEQTDIVFVSHATFSSNAVINAVNATIIYYAINNFSEII